MQLCRVTGPLVGMLPAAYASWAKLRELNLQQTALNGTVPVNYTCASWPLISSFQIDGAKIGGTLPNMGTCPLLSRFWVQNTPVTSNSSLPLWLLGVPVGQLPVLTNIGLGE